MNRATGVFLATTIRGGNWLAACTGAEASRSVIGRVMILNRRVEALQRELQKLEAELITGRADEGSAVTAEDRDLDNRIQQVVGEGALPPKDDDEHSLLEAALCQATVPNQVIAKMKQRWQRRIVKSSGSSGEPSGAAKIAVSFRRAESDLTEEDHQAARKAIDEMRRDLEERDKNRP